MSKSEPFQNGLLESGHALRILGAAPFLLQNTHDFIWQDPALCKALLRIHSDDLPHTAQDWALRLSPHDSRRRQEAISHLTWDGAQYALRYQIKMEDAHWLWVEERGERLSGDGETPKDISGVVINVEAVQGRIDRAAYLNSHDDLTGLWNADRFQEGLTQIIAVTERYRSEALCLRLRVSNLPDINRTYGYEQGDRLLKLIAARLKEAVNAPDITARISGRSFAVALCDRKAEDAAEIAAQLRSVLSETAYQSPNGPLQAEFEMSYTALLSQAGTAAQALSQTAAALEGSSEENGVIAFRPDLKAAKVSGSRKTVSADDILAALNDRRISLAFQPIIDAKTRALHHYECLLRLRLEAGEIISAGSFIMAAERLGLVHLLDRRALELAREALREYPDIHIALNVSAGTLKETDTAAAYMAALKALGPDAPRVSLELTETAALEDPAMAGRFSVEARALGCEFAIDDFGSGYTTFQNLLAIEADVIKIDGSFIEGIARTPHKETFVRMMVDLAQTFGVKTVAEMVDSRADAELLERLGVDYLQGYMFGFPSAAPAWRQAS